MKNHRTTYTSSSCKDKVWNLASPIRGYDPNKTRKDPYGNKISYCSYGKNTKQGWEIDHITPKARGGSDDIKNLQALQTKVNNKKSDTLVKKI